jgi:hypothetical protein
MGQLEDNILACGPLERHERIPAQEGIRKRRMMTRPHGFVVRVPGPL